MGMLKNFQQRDVAEALELLLHMVTMASIGKQPTTEDKGQLLELIREIKTSK